MWNLFDAATGPKYDGKYLHSKIQELLGDTKLSQTLTNIVIPTFDIKLLQPIVFSTFEVRILLLSPVEWIVSCTFSRFMNEW